GKGDHAKVAAYTLDLSDLGYDLKVEKGTWAETYDKLIDIINKESDQKKRFQLMHKAEDIIMATGALTPLYYYTNPYLLSKKVKGFFVTPLGFSHFEKCTVDGKGDSIAVCYGPEPDTLDPALNSTEDGATTLVHTFEGLARWEKTGENQYKIVPGCVKELVKGVENSDGTVTYTYTLRDGLTWSDGKALTAKDFEFAWKRASSDALGADYGEMYSVVKGYDTGELAVKAIDDKTLEVTTTNLIAYWDELMAFPVFFPTREDIVSNESWATDPKTFVCNGPYKITDWQHNSVITLTKRDEYWDAANISMKEIKRYLSDDHNTNLANWESGDWHFIEGIPTNEMSRIKKDYADQYVVAPYAGNYFVCWNVNKNILPA
ncbi:MAG: ABC transporter substrate-binding protein, partial [Coriobacteriales bacterium]|nr:ABC transporter substrate-binding protein [Coriobacteriales bacterium]